MSKILLTTDRTVVRRIETSDLGILTKMMTDSETMKHTGFRVPQTIETINEKVKVWTTDNRVWGVQEKTTADFIGWFMLKDTGLGFPELGFMITKEKWGMGHASEVARAILDYAFDELKIEKVVARADRTNIASIKVLEKIGMHLEPLKSNEKSVFFSKS
ncbi:GNAT family N-acetyltransferase [Bacteriovorax sp. Seq25_V]|uniref:GNAT family N-acetyltransferase n=1 Tax=Bacteriovorax sp. Seq25_V TaxID=1201288 RepID=UPI00038A36FC|nr:GNAT family N-acetyltransferase [Bacteriovorax sp. Seq25_V]EQC47297.1 acetyltransferase, GNAT family [Bacteriovorax sp. Seq25_V]